MPPKAFSDVYAIITRCRFKDRRFRLLEKGDGFLLQVEYDEPDVDNPNAGPVLQRARKWYLSPYSTETEIVETAFKAVSISMQHVVAEHFTYKGRRVYSPHFAIADRITMCDVGAFDGR